ncbi:MAG: signal peptide peptidase SppA [Bacteroidales bacterium]|jgi:protease-4|nr:signal peptide peptidase SppA [Bacteroidales bacterium]
MKSFFKMFLATVLGILVTPLLIFFIFVIIGIIALSKDSTPIIFPQSVLQLTLNGVISERTIDNPLDELVFPFSGLQQVSVTGLNTISAVLKQAKEDDNIKGIYLDISNISAPLATIDEIRNYLFDFKQSEKFIYCYSESLSQSSYYLASVSDKIFVHPQGIIDLRGLASEVIFFKGLLDKIDVDMQIIRHGTYKSAVEPFMLDKMSAANKEQIQTCLESVWSHIVNNIKESRSIDIETINNSCDSLLFLSDIEEAVNRGFIDGLMYKEQFNAFVRSELEMDEKEDIHWVSLKEYKKRLLPKKLEKDKIAVIYAVGDIIDTKEHAQFIGYSTAEEIIKAKKDKNVKAIVFRINSGGGSALISDVIWREVYLAQQEKPLVVSMGDYAASGGYYIACASSYIVAHPSTITGSIGVFGIIPNTEKLLANKLGITVDRVTTNSHSDAISLTRSLDAYERAVLQNTVEKTYSTFLQRVADGRNLTTSFVNSIGEGRVWSGADALLLNLVDTLGGIDVAIAKAAELADISNYTIHEQPVLKDFYQELVDLFLENKIKTKMQKSNLYQSYTYFNFASTLLEWKGIQARIPYIIDVY